jgi:hypothetical protein
MNAEQNHIEAELLAHLARINVPQSRLSLLTAGLRGTQAGVQQLLALDLGEAEPAARFQPPQP